MATEGEPPLKPFSRAEIYQYVSAQLRRNFAVDPLNILAAMQRTGRQIGAGLFSSVSALAHYNVGRELTRRATQPSLDVLAVEYEPRQLRRGINFSAQAEVDVEMPGGEVVKRGLWIRSSRRLNAEQWFDLAAEATAELQGVSHTWNKIIDITFLGYFENIGVP